MFVLMRFGVQVFILVGKWAVGVGGAAVESETDVRGEWDGVVGL